jgi:hypothetical protein
MNNGNSETLPLDQTTRGARPARTGATDDELSKLKHQLLQAEVRLARARATVVGAEIDIKVLNGRLKAFAK